MTDESLEIFRLEQEMDRLEYWRERAERAEDAREEYALRLAGALCVAEGNATSKDIETACDVVRLCPTIQAVLRLREEVEKLREEKRQANECKVTP